MDKWDYEEFKNELDFEAMCHDGETLYVKTSRGFACITNIHTVQTRVDDVTVWYDYKLIN